MDCKYRFSFWISHLCFSIFYYANFQTYREVERILQVNAHITTIWIPPLTFYYICFIMYLSIYPSWSHLIFFKCTSKQIANICAPPPKDFTVPIINLSPIIVYSFSFINKIYIQWSVQNLCVFAEVVTNVCARVKSKTSVRSRMFSLPPKSLISLPIQWQFLFFIGNINIFFIIFLLFQNSYHDHTLSFAITKSTQETLRDAGSIPGSGRFPIRGHGNPPQYSCLENPMDRGAWRATVPGITELDMT